MRGTQLRRRGEKELHLIRRSHSAAEEAYPNAYNRLSVHGDDQAANMFSAFEQLSGEASLIRCLDTRKNLFMHVRSPPVTSVVIV